MKKKQWLLIPLCLVLLAAAIPVLLLRKRAAWMLQD